MAVVGIKKLILQDRLHTSSFEGFLLRYYEQIITGIWAYMVLEFVESSIYIFLGNKEEARYLTPLYFVLLSIVTIIFFLSSIIIPEIRKLKLRRKLYNIGKEYNLSYQQKDRLRSIAANNMLCSGFFTKYGFVQFIMITLSNSIFVTAYFTCEYIIDVINTNGRPIILIMCFAAIFITLLMFAWILDSYLAKMIRNKNRYLSIVPGIKKNKHIYGKDLMVQLIQLIAKDTFENRTRQALIENFLEDVCQMVYVFNDKKN